MYVMRTSTYIHVCMSLFVRVYNDVLPSGIDISVRLMFASIVLVGSRCAWRALSHPVPSISIVSSPSICHWTRKSTSVFIRRLHGKCEWEDVWMCGWLHRCMRVWMRGCMIVWVCRCDCDSCILSLPYRGNLSRNHHLVDLAALVLRYPIADATPSGSIPLPVSCSLVVGSQIQSMVSGSGFLEPGNYVVLPLAFNHWRHVEGEATNRGRVVSREATNRGKTVSREATDRACVVSVFTSRMITYDDHVMTSPGFLAESLFLLAANTKPKSQVLFTLL